MFKFKFNKPKTGDIAVSIPTQEREGNLVLSDHTFSKLRDVIYKLCGIYYTDSKKYLLEGRIIKRITALNLNTYEEYISFIQAISGRSELNQLFEAITINETYFFRAQQQFEAFENIVVPEILNSRPSNYRSVFRIWSAASSSGEEAYTLAILVLERLRHKYPNVQFQILASDINNAVLENARKGVYKEYSVRSVPPEYMDKYFTKNGTTYLLKDEVKRMVKFMNINLYDPIAMSTVTGCDVVFCCNVLIYFDLPSKQQVVSHLYKSLNNNGYLFIGYSESLHGVSKAFKLVHLPKSMVYKKE
ncbi:MAG: protein-glutamate O-methyltransferase CheR [Candidatus Kapabacteria bacterium]|nr:protein-glutamate O-methyltransferase CheR [Candidatus Kapabacteria bacterium]